MGKFKELLDMFNDPEFDKARKEATLTLLFLLKELILKHPEQRFSQILTNYGFTNGTNEFYLEPVELLKRVKERINDLENPKG